MWIGASAINYAATVVNAVAGNWWILPLNAAAWVVCLWGMFSEGRIAVHRQRNILLDDAYRELDEAHDRITSATERFTGTGNGSSGSTGGDSGSRSMP